VISELCLCDLDGVVDVVLRHDGHIEAPNWHADGYLIVNGGGRIFRVPLDAPELVEIDTGFAQACNNDHGISPDGATLVISDSSRAEKSCIYTLPIGGGTPVRVTPDVPSWWHGWSPDGTRLAYVGARGDRVVQLYTSRLDGTDEREVAPGFDHIDGPDYTADGAYIWFNGERNGAVNLWRVRPDGQDLQQMSDGDAVDWFPHPSPCGQHVVFLEYPPKTVGHPGGLDVAIALMPATGGARRILARLHGGQGTINVPSWAPDATRFAFVRYQA
jgi:Tol biopolymer transport system component